MAELRESLANARGQQQQKKKDGASDEEVRRLQETIRNMEARLSSVQEQRNRLLGAIEGLAGESLTP